MKKEVDFKRDQIPCQYPHETLYAIYNYKNNLADMLKICSYSKEKLLDIYLKYHMLPDLGENDWDSFCKNFMNIDPREITKEKRYKIELV